MKKINEVQQLFNRVCEVYNLPQTAKRKIDNPEQKDYYSNDFYKLDYASCYGGYSFRKVMTGTGEDFAFNTGMRRRSKKEAIEFLSGLLAAKSLVV